MYESYFGFNEKPFSLLCDPAFLYRSKSHGEASAVLSYGLLNQAGFTVITGPVGIGKTTLIRSALREVPEDVVVGVISNTHPDMGNLLQWTLLAFGQDYKSDSRVELYDWFVQFLKAEYTAGRRAVLVIDEAQNLSRKDLEELRMLSNINAEKDQLLQLILVGQPHLRDLLGHPYLLQFSQRVAADYDVRPLDLNETTNYIFNRCRVAGVERALFTYAAAELVYLASEGVPRVINVICDTALAYTFGAQESFVSEETVVRVVQDRKDSGLIPLGELPATVLEKFAQPASGQAQVADIESARKSKSSEAS